MPTDRDFIAAAMRDAADRARREVDAQLRAGQSRRLPHVGLGGTARSMYGEHSTLGEAERRRAAMQEQLMAAVRAQMHDQGPTLPLGPIRVEATVGRALCCEIEGCEIHAR